MKDDIDDIKKFVNSQNWIFAKTMPEIPHYYIVRDNLSDPDRLLFDILEGIIQKKGYIQTFCSKEYKYYNIGKFKYWVLGNILNKANLQE